MNNLREEAECILETFRQLDGHDLDNEDLMINFLENGLKRAWLDGGIAANERAQEIIQDNSVDAALEIITGESDEHA